MNLAESKIGDVYVLTIEGDVDAGTAPEVEERLQALIQASARQLVLDLSAVPYVSSAFLRVVLSTARDIRHKGGDLRLAGLQPSVRAVFDLSGFSKLFAIYDDAPTAAASYGS